MPGNALENGDRLRDPHLPLREEPLSSTLGTSDGGQKMVVMSWTGEMRSKGMIWLLSIRIGLRAWKFMNQDNGIRQIN